MVWYYLCCYRSNRFFITLAITIITSGKFSIFFGLIFGGIYAFVGGTILSIGLMKTKEENKILNEGILYKGKIFAYDYDNSVHINGRSMLLLVLRYFENGKIREAVVSSGTIRKEKYPIGKTVSFKKLEGKSALVPKSLSDEYLEGEDRLLNANFNPNITAPTVSVSCPGCSANLSIPVGMSEICPYCNRKIDVDFSGRVIIR